MVVPDARTACAIRWCSPPRISPASRARSRSAARRRSRRSPTAPRRFPRSTRSAAPATPTSPRPSGACSAPSASTWSPASRRSSSSPTRRANPDWVAMDLFSQAEHDELAQAILRHARRGAARRGRGERAAADRGDAAARRSSRRRSRSRGALDQGARPRRGLRDRRTASRRSTWSSRSPIPAALLPKIRHAGAIFMGHHASEALGDYCAGPNHVLPTGRTARFSSPLGVYDFQKRSSVLARLGAAARSARARRGDARARRRTGRARAERAAIACRAMR